MTTKQIIISLSVCLVLFLRYVGYVQVFRQTAGPADEEKKTVLTTFTILADMTQHIAGDLVRVESITGPGENIHTYEPTPQDLVRAQSADLILDNGLNLELWAEKLYNSVPDVPHVTLTEGITPVSITKGTYQGKPNPHAWMSPTIAVQYVENITAALSELAPEHAQAFEKNAAQYIDEIRDIDTRLRVTIEQIPASQRYLVTCEGAFTYLAEDYGLTELYMWPINADGNGTPQQIAELITTVQASDVPTVFCESTVSSKPMEQVAQETGTQFGGVFYVDALSPADGPATTYLDLLTYNIDTLVAGLDQ